MNVSKIIALSKYLESAGFTKEAQKINTFKDKDILKGVMPDFDWLKQGRNFNALSNNYPEFYNNFVELNSDILVNFEPTQYLGSGYFGDAWLLSDNTVLKIFHNTEFEQGYNMLLKYKNLMKQQETNQASSQEPMIYEVGNFKIPEEETVYFQDSTFEPAYVVLEKVKSTTEIVDEYAVNNDKKIDKNTLNFYELPKGLQTKINLKEFDNEIVPQKQYVNEYIYYVLNKIIATISDKIEKDYYKYAGLDEGQSVYDYSNKEDLEEVATIFSKLPYVHGQVQGITPKDVTAIEDMLGLKSDWLKKLTQVILKNILANRYDLHASNLGFRHDNPIFFDF